MRLSHSTCIGSLQVVTSLFHASLLASLLFGSNQLLPGTDAASADVEQHHQHHQSQQHDNQQQSRRQPHQQPVIHKQMNEHDLRKVFQVQSHDEVPEYDIVHLDVINRRPSDVDGGSSTNINEEGQEDYLSKRSNNNQRRDFNDRTGSGSTSTSNSNDDTLKYVYLNAFGNGMHLNLKRNDELHHKLKSLKLITAESRSTATSSKWAPPSHVNVEGVRYSESSIQGEGEDSVGVPYHDDHHVAAVIVSTGPDGQATLDGTIGNDLVIKPVPSSIKLRLQPDERSDPITYAASSGSASLFEPDQGRDSGFASSPSSTPTLPAAVSAAGDGRDDDELFLDQDDDVSVKDLTHLKKKRRKSNTGFNLINKKKVEKFEQAKTTAFSAAADGSDSHDNYHVPKLSKSREDMQESAGGNGRRSMTKVAHIIFKKKQNQASGEEHPHSDFMPLEPGHMYTASVNKGSVELHDSFPSNYSLVRPRDEDMTSSHESLFKNSTTAHRRSKRQSPDTVWPEVLLVVDYDSYLLHGGNSRDVKRYFISFWNGVDLRYKLLTHPRIRVSLAGMIVAKDRDATPYLERNRLRAPNADAVDAAGALTDMGKYLYREDRLPTYDLAVVITKLDMCRRRYEGGRCNRGTAGFAYVGGACVVNKRLEKVNSVAIIEDSGGFSGIIVAAHEVGHLLGCVHDGSPPPSYLGGPGATRCPWEDGFIMSDLRHTERGFRWSSCSVEQFKHFLNGETATCLYNYPHENQLLPRVLPGTMLSLDEQCKRDRGTNACFKDARVCAQLFCFDSASGYCVSYRPAAEGSSCGDGQVCRNGKCTAELENIIPDYTHVTSVVASRNPSASDDRLLSRSDHLPPTNVITVTDRRSRSRNVARSLDRPILPPPPPQQQLSPYNSQRMKKLSTGSCHDIVDKMAGSLSCADFLDRFGYRYCNHSYVKRNCCASHAIICNRLPASSAAASSLSETKILLPKEHHLMSPSDLISVADDVEISSSSSQ